MPKSLAEFRYYSGTKRAGPHKFRSESKAVEYEIASHWHNTGRSHTVRCGASSDMTGTREEGVEVTELDRFTSVIGGSIGAEGLASLKSEMESTTEVQVAWQKKRTCSDTFNIPAPDCGAQTWLLYQLVRDYSFNIEVPRLLRKPRKEAAQLREWTFHYDLFIDTDPDDSACRCKKKDEPAKEAELISLRIGHVTLRLDAIPIGRSLYRFIIGPKSYLVREEEIRSGTHYIALVDPPQIIRGLVGAERSDLPALVEWAEIEDEAPSWLEEHEAVEEARHRTRDTMFGERWLLLKGRIKEQWVLLTDDDLAVAEGSAEELAGRIHVRHGIEMDEAERQVEEFSRQNKLTHN